MITETLREMGVVCRNKQIGERLKSHYRNRFQDSYQASPRQAEVYKKEFMWWLNKVMEIDEHLKQLHLRLRGS